jgi:ribosomal protein L30/L7E
MFLSAACKEENENKEMINKIKKYLKYVVMVPP